MWPFRKKYPAGLSAIQTEVFEAINAGNGAQLMKLMRAYDQVIRHEFGQWRTVPVEFRVGKWQDWYANGLMGLADAYRQCGDSSLIDGLMEKPGENPIDAWQEAIAKAQEAINDNRPGPALLLIEPLIPEIEKLSGSAVDNLLPVCYGIVGAANYRNGHRDGALAATRKALEFCVKSNDADGIAVYTRNLQEIENAK